jgi:3-phosphoshikimate 1-carboxyvinyltransferase
VSSGRLSSHPSGPLQGAARAPGDKSISHRALILGAMAKGVTRIEGLLEGADVLATAAAVQAMGADVKKTGVGCYQVVGTGKLASADIDCGNSGTGARLLMGAVCGYSSVVRIDGDASLRSRPMGRVIQPLSQMGGRFEGDRLPLTVRGGALKSIRYLLPVASAQVKSAILLAGVNAEGQTEVVEPEPTRDHTERMLRAFGADVVVRDDAEGRHILLTGGQTLKAADVLAPGDPSSAAFPIVAALVTPGSSVRVEGVLINTLRTGLFQTLIERGADLKIENARQSGGEPVGDLVAKHSALKGVVVPKERAPSMIDEYPILAVAAAFASGETIMDGIGELRVKESDRIALMAAGLSACGVSVQELSEGLVVRGGDTPPRGGAVIRTRGDHRIAMSHLVLGLGALRAVVVDEPDMIATSFPGFADLMNGLGGGISEA